MNSTLHAMLPDHWSAVCAIYAEGIATGHATFETVVPDWAVWDRNHLAACRLVALAGDRVVGWAALRQVSRRIAWEGVAEVSVYVATDAQRKGIGTQLLERLVRDSEEAGIWTLQAAVFPENIGTIRLHENAGFRRVGRREQIGQIHGEWRDTLILERRSENVGMPESTKS
jgi:phosphinothricin acetyltransferase